MKYPLVGARVPSRGLTESANRSRVGAMDLFTPVGQSTGRCSLLVEQLGRDSAWVYGSEIPFGTKVQFRYEGISEQYMTLYDVLATNTQVNEFWVLELDDQSSLCNSRTPGKCDFRYAHDACCGVGGFGTAFEFLGGKVVSAIDRAVLAANSYKQNHATTVICEDLGTSRAIHAMHCAQLDFQCQPLMLAGFPCQPLSRQGLRKGHADPRSATLGYILHAARLLHVCAIVLECVSEALRDPHTQHVLQRFACLDGFDLSQTVLQLHTIWPSRRTRWFAVLVRHPWKAPSVNPLPVVQPAPAVQDIIGNWPVWPDEDEANLAWTDLEKQVYFDPAFGNTDRKLVLTDPLPTALHTWGNVLAPCPCGCRSHGLHKATLIAGGLRGVLVTSSKPSHHPRHIHPRELQVLLGFPPFQECWPDCRAALCLFGNCVSPIQALWVTAHLWHDLDFSACSPIDVLRCYLQSIQFQYSVSWPFDIADNFVARIGTEGHFVEVVCRPGSTVAQLVQAQTIFEQSHWTFGLRFHTADLPLFAGLRPLDYELTFKNQIDLNSIRPVPFKVTQFGATRHFFGPVGLTIRAALQWQGIDSWIELKTPDGATLNENSLIFRGMHVVVISCPETVAFELALLALPDPHAQIGFGSNTPGAIQTPQSWLGQDLWYLDHILKNHLFSAWAALDFPKLTVWVPTFTDAVLELWPSSIEPRLKEWLCVSNFSIFAIILEAQGWNLVSFRLTRSQVTVSFYDQEQSASGAASRLANRVFGASGRPFYAELLRCGTEVSGEVGSLDRVLALLDWALGVPPCVAEALRLARPNIELVPTRDNISASPSTTLPFTAQSGQFPVPPVSTCEDVPLGITAAFILDFARALVGSCPLSVTRSQVHVVCIDPTQPEIGCSTTACFHPDCAPIFVFFLYRSHWTLVHCMMQEGNLVIVQYDGFRLDSTLGLSAFVDALKRRWNPVTVQITHTWLIEQHREDSCGTIALGHFAYILGLISDVQAQSFETLHPSFAVCSRLCTPIYSPLGFGQKEEEEAIVASLAQILPAKGVPENKVRERALEGIKALGIQPLQKALEAKNVWAALKGVGSARPKPFLWISHAELQEHIKHRASTRFGADADQTRPKGHKQQRSAPAVATLLDPSSLNLLPGIFVSNDGTSVDQIAIQEVQKNVRGVAFASIAEAKPFLAEGKFISTEALALLVVGSLPADVAHSLPAHAVRVPAIYRGTQEPILADCTIIQIGDQAVYAKQNQRVKEIAVFPTVVFRVHVFQDLWSEEAEWKDFVAKPLKSLVQAFPILTLCRNEQCDRNCGCFHPSIEEEGVEAAILDTWGFHWHTIDGNKTTPAKAAVLSFYIRLLESNFNTVHLSSGQSGTFFEPRKTDTPGPDPAYAIIWLSQCSLKESLHKVRTHDHLLAVCRLGHKFGVRCLSKHEEELFRTLCPSKPFVKCDIREIFRLEPLPAGLQRHSLVELLKDMQWSAKPLQPCKGSQGQAWTVGATGPPPTPFFQAKHGWVTITKVKDATQKQTPQHLIATVKTRQHIRDGASSTSQAAGSEDPWHKTGVDPWGSYVGVTCPPPPVATHVQSKIDDVEQRIHDNIKTHVDSTIEASVTNLGGHIATHTTSRLDTLEQQLAVMRQQQQQLEHWCVDSSSKIANLQQGFDATSAQLQEQSTVLHGVVKEVSGLKEEVSMNLQSYFDKQADRLEALLAKKARHS